MLQKASSALERLKDLGLLQEQAGNALFLHRLLAVFVQSELDVAEAQTAVEETLWREAKRLNRAGRSAELLVWQAHLREVTDMAQKQENERGARLCYELGYHLNEIGDSDRARSYLEQALNFYNKIKDNASRVDILNALGNAYRYNGMVNDAISCYEEALSNATGTGDSNRLLTCLNHLGLARRDIGQPEQAIKHFKDAQSIAKDLKDEYHQGILLSEIGLCHFDLGKIEQAIEEYNKALNIIRKIDDREGEAEILGRLGKAYRNLGEPKKAIEQYLHPALEISKEIRNGHLERLHLRYLGNAYCALGNEEEALEYYEQALKMCRESGAKRGECAVLLDLGTAYRELKDDVPTAIEKHEEALFIAKDRRRRTEGAAWGELGLDYLKKGDWDYARVCFETALPITERAGDLLRKGVQWGNLGRAYRQLGQQEQAKKCLQKSLEILMEIKSVYTKEVRSWLEELAS